MENKFEKLERIFVEYIINLIGPNEEIEIERSEKLKIMKKILTSSFSIEDNTVPHIFCFGSFPMKTYLPDSDMDITIILEDKETGSIITQYSYEFLNKILSLIQNTLESYAQESGYPPIITEISLIMADVKLIKCKYEDLSFDISINNFVGLCKLILINSFEKLLVNPNLFKRSLFLIKAWCYYEGSLLGSNLGLLASYALEIIVMYIFNKNNDMIKTEIDALCFFFEKINEFNWEKDILSILGKISLDDFQEEFKHNIFPMENLLNKIKEKNFVFQMENLKNLIPFFERFSDLDKIQNFNSNKKIFSVKYLNVIDPMYNNNNLGKSVNLHNYNKFVKVIENELRFIHKLKEMRYKNISPDKYLNLLLQIFEKTITYHTPELFFYNLPQPRIFISPNNYYVEELNNNPYSFNYNHDNINGNNNNSLNYNNNFNNPSNFGLNNINNNNNIDLAPGFGIGFMENNLVNSNSNFNYSNNSVGNNTNFNSQTKDDLKSLINDFNKLFLEEDKNKKIKKINSKTNDNIEINTNTAFMNSNNNEENKSKINIEKEQTRIEKTVDIFNDFGYDEKNNLINKNSNFNNSISNNNYNYQNTNINNTSNNFYSKENENIYEYGNKNNTCLTSFLWPNRNEIGNPNDMNFVFQNYNQSTNKNLISKEILDFICENMENFDPYCFSTVNEINSIENFLNNCKFSI